MIGKGSKHICDSLVSSAFIPVTLSALVWLQLTITVVYLLVLLVQRHPLALPRALHYLYY